MRLRLGVNVDHVATVRQARRGTEPDPVAAAEAAQAGGADSIVCHLREDRRHIQDGDLRRLKSAISVPLNLEMGLAPGIIAIALRVKPARVTLVPERRRELTTEGGLDVRGGRERIARAVARFHDAGIGVSLFIDPDLRQIEASQGVRADMVEIHTGAYAHHPDRVRLKAVARAADDAASRGLEVAAGHGLTLENTPAIAAIPAVEELNIGHSIVSRALFVGLERAVREMRRVMARAR